MFYSGDLNYEFDLLMFEVYQINDGTLVCDNMDV